MLFPKCHTATSAHHWHETKLCLDGGEDQTLLIEQPIQQSDVSWLYTEWQKRELGDNGNMWQYLGKPALPEIHGHLNFIFINSVN